MNNLHAINSTEVPLITKAYARYIQEQVKFNEDTNYKFVRATKVVYYNSNRTYPPTWKEASKSISNPTEGVLAALLTDPAIKKWYKYYLAHPTETPDNILIE